MPCKFRLSRRKSKACQEPRATCTVAVQSLSCLHESEVVLPKGKYIQNNYNNPAFSSGLFQGRGGQHLLRPKQVGGSGGVPPQKFVILMPSRLVLLHSQPILKPKIMTGYANDKPVS